MTLLGRGNRKRREAPRVQVPAVPWMRIGSALGVVLVVVATVLAGRWMLNRPIERVVINGEFERVSADRLEALLRRYMGRGFLGTALESIQTEVGEMPWVAGARVSRKWPDTLEVFVTEEVPAARWGEAGLLNPQGRLFVTDARHIPAGLPHLNGPEGTQAEVAARYVAIQEQLLQRGLGVVALALDSRGSWSFQLSNGVRVRIGSVDVDSRLERFYAALDTVVAPVAADVAYVDMRYTNGFALGWKQQRSTGSGDEADSERMRG